jgi:hypothetical protein
MIKNYLYAGAVLVVIAVVAFYIVAGYITSGSPTSITNVTVLGGHIQDVPILVNSSQISIIFVFATNLTNIYFLNQSMFNGLSSYISGNSLHSAYSYVSAQGLNKSDAFISNNTAVKEINQVEAKNVTPSYYIYAVVDSTPGSPSYNGIVNASVVYKSYSYGDWISHSGEALVAVVALIAGVALLIYGVVKKPKYEAEAPENPPATASAKKRGKS